MGVEWMYKEPLNECQAIKLLMHIEIYHAADAELYSVCLV